MDVMSEGENQHHHHHRADEVAGMHHFRHDGGHAHAAVNIGAQHATIHRGRGHRAGGVHDGRCHERA
jgi:hypothetical protein